ncbi:hypothetical protein ACSCB1_32715 [Streptomyces europaeiscabiei]|uniref:Secreted protein n=1 Tax=Streptomyces europaeiscabiei TaxID=146819 RepID=A0ABU4NQ07_9ACTN|nr:hypothetical protein [Streptomyces europaeiscabiei]MDX2529054.1 hypothetical protein [Streptomyces europaeiscabiei]MDX2767210.1 hypothetical protein [Streptomyces europaeiscabiei]MDX3546640.1 hypothetical protein [Streptomyces europaeiscabiei]MDX3556334.1 hypothetical protein [Streptomyces europaeiscabiei]MDX3704177.1 hypothetical protein [Streptomyces europaeiscabiei]
MSNGVRARRPRVRTWTGSAVAAVCSSPTRSGLSTEVVSSFTASSSSAPAADARSASSLAALQGRRFTLVTGELVTVGTD